MAKAFKQALEDGFYHITDSISPDRMRQLRNEDVLCDEEGYWSFQFGPNNEFEWTVEPCQDENYYLIAVYKNGIVINEKLRICSQP